MGFPGNSVVKNLPAVQELQETRVPSLGQEVPLEEGMATHSYSCLENLVDKKMLNTTSYYRNANHNYKEVSPHTGQKDHN